MGSRIGSRRRARREQAAADEEAYNEQREQRAREVRERERLDHETWLAYADERHQLIKQLNALGYPCAVLPWGGGGLAIETKTLRRIIEGLSSAP